MRASNGASFPPFPISVRAWRQALGLSEVAGNGDIGALSVDSLLNIFGQAYNPLDPSVAVNLSSVVRVLREPTAARREQLKADHEAAAALCLKLGLAQVHEADGQTLSCMELRETGFKAGGAGPAQAGRPGLPDHLPD